MAENNYFSHDYNARNDPKILAMRSDRGPEGYGLYWMIAEKLYEQGGEIIKFPMLFKGLSSEFFVAEDHLKQFFSVLISDYQLLKENDSCYWSDTVKRRLEIRESKRLIKVKAGKIGGKRSGASRNRSSASQNEAKKGKKGKKERKEINEADVHALWGYFLEKTGKKFQLSKDRLDLIKNKLEDYTLDQLKTIVDNFMKDDWEGRAAHMDLIYCIGRQKGKPDNCEKWLNFTGKKKEQYENHL